METKKLLNKLHKELGAWVKVAEELGITYSYICMLRNGRIPGKRLLKDIQETVKLLGL